MGLALECFRCKLDGNQAGLRGPASQSAHMPYLIFTIDMSIICF